MLIFFFPTALISPELPSLLPIVDVAEALLHVRNGDWFLCLLVANVPDSFNEGTTASPGTSRPAFTHSRLGDARVCWCSIQIHHGSSPPQKGPKWPCCTRMAYFHYNVLARPGSTRRGSPSRSCVFVSPLVSLTDDALVLNRWHDNNTHLFSIYLPLLTSQVGVST